MVCSWHDTWIAHTGKRGMKGRYPGTGPVHLLAPQHKGKILTATLIRYDTWHFDRLRVVPRFPSWIVDRVKRECAWKSPHARKAKRGEEREKWGTKDKAQAFDPSRPNDIWSVKFVSPFKSSVNVECWQLLARFWQMLTDYHGRANQSFALLE